MLFTQLLLLLLSFLTGSIPFAVIVARLLNTPAPSLHGSKNPGATNMVRLAGKKAGLLTLLGDSLKGFLLLEILKQILLPVILSNSFEQQALLSLCAICIVLGHIYSIFLKFRGGKGVATSGGVLLALNFNIGITAVCLWIISFVIFRVSSVAAIMVGIFLPITVYILEGNSFIFGTSLVLSSIMLLSHKSNIINLLFNREQS